MKKETLLTVTVLALLLLNLGTLGFLFLRRPPHPPEQGSGRVGRQIVEALQLNPDQERQFEQLKTTHHEKMMQSDKAYREALEQYFALLKNDTFVPAQRDSLQAALTQIQQNRTSTTFQHFSDLKALCTPEQRQHFADLIPTLMQVILPGKDGPNNRRRKD